MFWPHVQVTVTETVDELVPGASVYVNVSGAVFGALHGAFSATALINILLPVVHPRMGSPLSAADSTPQIEAPGFLMLNYGRRTPAVGFAAHIAYGAIVGGFVSRAR